MNRLPVIGAIALLLVGASLLLSLLPKTQPDLAIAVASNFAAPAKEIVEAFERSTGHSVSVSTSSTGKHYAQIVNGAPFDIFLAADSERPRKLIESGVAIPGSRFVYAIGRLALWSPDPKRFTTGLDFFKESKYKRLSVANPKLAPYGAAADEFLNSLGITTREECVLGENIAQTFHFVKSGSTDAGLVALSQIRLLPAKEKGSLWIVPSERHSPITQEAVLLKDTPDAREFLSFLKSEPARKIIENFGYDLP